MYLGYEWRSLWRVVPIHALPQQTQDMPPDGLYIDYNEFSTITKDLLKNANVLRDKSPNSPTLRRGRLGDANSHQTGS